ncbi:hypothetical protein GJ496_011385 [Pomphorhynchus laevis]|nr:hypothetical protein GJ496_011385 [Pomphorhynchus laevis]
MNDNYERSYSYHVRDNKPDNDFSARLMLGILEECNLAEALRQLTNLVAAKRFDFKKLNRQFVSNVLGYCKRDSDEEISRRACKLIGNLVMCSSLPHNLQEIETVLVNVALKTKHNSVRVASLAAYRNLAANPSFDSCTHITDLIHYLIDEDSNIRNVTTKILKVPSEKYIDAILTSNSNLLTVTNQLFTALCKYDCIECLAIIYYFIEHDTCLSELIENGLAIKLYTNSLNCRLLIEKL